MSRALKSMRVKMTHIRILPLILAGLISGLSVTACAKTPAEEATVIEQSSLESEILAVMEGVKEDWNSFRYDEFSKRWDESDSNPLYLAEESDVIMTSWPQIEKYWAGTKAWNEWIVVDYFNYNVKSVDETHAMVSFELRFDVKLNDRPKPIGGDNRAVVSLRKINGEWKIYAWVEAPLAAITYMRKLYELNVRPDLPNSVK